MYADRTKTTARRPGLDTIADGGGVSRDFGNWKLAMATNECAKKRRGLGRRRRSLLSEARADVSIPPCSFQFRTSRLTYLRYCKRIPLRPRSGLGAKEFDKVDSLSRLESVFDQFIRSHQQREKRSYLPHFSGVYRSLAELPSWISHTPTHLVLVSIPPARRFDLKVRQPKVAKLNPRAA